MRVFPSLDHELFLHVEGTRAEQEKVIQALTFLDKKKEKEYRDALRDGSYAAPPAPTCFYDLENDRIFAGHLSYLVEWLKVRGVHVDVIPTPPTEGVQPYPLDGISYREHQKEAVVTAIQRQVGILQLPTATGKTLIAASILATLDKPSLVLLPYVPLLQQTLGEYQRWGLPGMGLFTKKSAGSHLHTLTHAGLLQRHLSSRTVRAWLQSIEVLIADEVQLASAPTWISIILACTRAKYRIGLSGTPFSSASGPESIRDFQLLGLFGDVIYQKTATELKDLGFMAIPEIYMLPVNSIVRTNSQKRFYSQAQKSKEWLRVYKEGITENEERNSLAAQAIFILSKLAKMKTLVLVQHIDHGRDCLRRLLSLGVSAAFVIGNALVYFDPDAEPEKDPINGFKSETVNRFIQGEFDVLIASPVFGVGYSLPGESVDAAVLLTAGRDHRATLQRLGRALRPRPGDNKVVIVDFFDHQHYYLIAQSKKRAQEYQQEGHAVYGWKEFYERFMKAR